MTRDIGVHGVAFASGDDDAILDDFFNRAAAMRGDAIPELTDADDPGACGGAVDESLAADSGGAVEEPAGDNSVVAAGDSDVAAAVCENDVADPRAPWERFAWDASLQRWLDSDGNTVDARRFLGGWSVLQMLGVHGCRCIDEAIVAGLAIDSPVLLIGAPGSAKTAMTQRIATDLGMRYWAYDASKAMFEDIVGFPDPASLARGKVVYVPTPLSLVDKEFILIDEVSRANPGLQNKWLEIIRAHQVMGMELPSLRIVFGAMNPAGLAGTVPLDEALAGRFTFHISVPEAQHMSDEERRTVMEAPDGIDAAYVCEGSRLRFIIDAVRADIGRVAELHGVGISKYLNALSVYMGSKDWPLDGRRLGMMRRGLIALLAARRVIRGQDVSNDDLGPVIRDGLGFLLPFAATGRDLPRLLLDGGHQYSMAALRGKRRSLAASDVYDAVLALMNGDSAVDKDGLSQMVTRLLQAIDNPRNAGITIKAAAALFMLMSSPGGLEKLPLESRQRVMIQWTDMMDINTDDIDEYLQESRGIEVPSNIPIDQVDGFLRLSFSTKAAICATRMPNVEFESVVEKMAEIIVAGGAE